MAGTLSVRIREATCMCSNSQTAAEVASGTPYSRSATSVMTPSVPSEPTSRCVKS